MQQKLIKVADYLHCTLEKLCEKFSYLALALKSPNPITISNICQNFHISKSDEKENQNPESIYYRS